MTGTTDYKYDLNYGFQCTGGTGVILSLDYTNMYMYAYLMYARMPLGRTGRCDLDRAYNPR